MNRSLTGIVVIAVIALGMFGFAAYLLGESSPKLKLKVAAEREFPVKVQAIETAVHPVTHRVTVRIRARPTAGTLTADQVAALAARAAGLLTAPDTARIEYDAIEVAQSDEPPATFERWALERRARLEARLPAISETLGRAWGAAPRLRVVEQRPPVVVPGLPAVDLGIALAERPPDDRDDAAIASAVLGVAPAAAYVVVPAREPAQAPAVIRRGRRR